MSARVRWSWAVSAVGAAAVAVSAVQMADAPRASEDPFARVPAAARARANPFAGNADAVAAGHKLYKEHCAVCHGPTARGTRYGPSLATDAVRNATPGEIEWFLRNGTMRGGMPSWSGLPEQRRWQLTAYLASEPAD